MSHGLKSTYVCKTEDNIEQNVLNGPGNTAKNNKKQQQQQILLKFNIRTNEIIFPPANSPGTNRGGGGKTYMY